MFAHPLKHRTLVGIDAGSKTIKVLAVKATQPSAFEVIGMGAVATPEGLLERGHVGNPQQLGELLKEALDQAKIRQRHAALVVPATLGFVRRISFPPMPLSELRKSFDLQPERYIPFAQDGAVYDLYPLPHNSEQTQQEVVVGAAPRPVVEDLLQAARIAGLVPVRVDLEPLALYRAATATEQVSAQSAVAIVDIGGFAAKISLFEDGIPVVSRVVDMPAMQADQRADGTTDLFWDIRRSLEFALTQLQMPLSRVLVTGGVGGDDYLALSLAAYLRSFLANRLPGDFQVEPMRDAKERVPMSHLLALGLSLPPEMFS